MFIKPKNPLMVDRKNQRVSLQFFPKVPSFSPAKPRTLWAVGVSRCFASWSAADWWDHELWLQMALVQREL